MPLSPQTLERISLETVKKDLKVYEDGVRHTLAEGWAVMQTAGPAHRLRGYKACTYPEDLPLVLTENYIQLWHAGIMPPLRAMTEWQRITQPEPDGKGGFVIPQPSDFHPYYWALLSICPPYVFEFKANDFRKLLKAEIDREATA